MFVASIMITYGHVRTTDVPGMPKNTFSDSRRYETWNQYKNGCQICFRLPNLIGYYSCWTHVFLVIKFQLIICVCCSVFAYLGLSVRTLILLHSRDRRVKHEPNHAFLLPVVLPMSKLYSHNQSVISWFSYQVNEDSPWVCNQIIDVRISAVCSVTRATEIYKQDNKTLLL